MNNAKNLTLLLCVMALKSAHAGEAKMVPAEQDVATVKIVLTPSGLQTAKRITEKALQETGCTLGPIDDVEKIKSLIELAKSVISEDPQKGFAVEPRNAIYLNMKSGAKIKYLFGDANSRQNSVQGLMSSGLAGDTKYIKIDKDFFSKIRLWEGQEVKTSNVISKCLLIFN